MVHHDFLGNNSLRGKFAYIIRVAGLFIYPCKFFAMYFYNKHGFHFLIVLINKIIRIMRWFTPKHIAIENNKPNLILQMCINMCHRAICITTASWYPEELDVYTNGPVAHINSHLQNQVRFVVLYRNMFGREPSHYANDFIDEYYKKMEPVFVVKV